MNGAALRKSLGESFIAEGSFGAERLIEFPTFFSQTNWSKTGCVGCVGAC